MRMGSLAMGPSLCLVLLPCLALLLCLALPPAVALGQSIPNPPPRPFDLGGAIVPGQALVTPPRTAPPAEPGVPGSPRLVTAPEPPVRPAFPPSVAAARGASPASPPEGVEPEPVVVPPVPPPVVRPSATRQTAIAAAAPPAPPDNFVSKLRSWFTPSDRPGDDEEDEWPRRTRGQRASLNTEPAFDPNEKPERPGLSTDPGVSTKCLPDVLQTVLQKVIARYGAVKVTSTYRPAWRARRGSYHRRCEAVDFRVPGVRPGEVLSIVKEYEETGGHKVYWNGLIHVDTGPYRTWRGSRR